MVLRYGVRPAIGVDGALAVLWIDGSATIGLRRGKRGKSVRRWWEGAIVEGMSRWMGRWWVFGSAYVGGLYGESDMGYMYARRVGRKRGRSWAVWGEGEWFLICDLSKSGDNTSKAV